MRKVRYEEYLAFARKRFPAIRAKIENYFEGRVARGRPYDMDKERILLEMDRLRWKRAIQSGEIQSVGERRWRVRIKPGL